MEVPAAKKPIARQPFTPRGVAAFAGASWGRFFLAQAIVAGIAAVAVVWLVRSIWFPVLTEAVNQLPPQAEIRHGELKWTSAEPVALAENYFLGISVDLNHAGQARSSAHIGIEFGRKDVTAFSLLGYVKFPYPTDWRIALNRPEVVPAWGAWRPAFLAVTGLGTVAVLFISWAALATIYFLPTWLAAYFANRQLTFPGGWRLCGAALLPGAIFFTACLVLYGMGGMDLIRLTVAAGIHLLVGWAYLAAALSLLPCNPAAITKENPFAPAKIEVKNDPKIESPPRLG